MKLSMSVVSCTEKEGWVKIFPWYNIITFLEEHSAWLPSQEGVHLFVSSDFGYNFPKLNSNSVASRQNMNSSYWGVSLLLWSFTALNFILWTELSEWKMTCHSRCSYLSLSYENTILQINSSRLLIGTTINNTENSTDFFFFYLLNHWFVDTVLSYSFF